MDFSASRAQLTEGVRALNYPASVLATSALPDAGVLVMSDIQVSERAASRIGAILKGEPAGTMLRVSVEGGGCSGFQYKFDMEREKTEDDIVIERDGAVVLIDSVSSRYLAGSEIDFV